jgi:acetyl/propionyl-CoA carboxylase alpha subunit
MTKTKLLATLDGQEHEMLVEKDGSDSHLVRIWLDGKMYSVDAYTLPSEIVTVLINGKSYDIDIEELGAKGDSLDGSLGVRVRGRVVYLEMLEERRKKLKEAQATKFMDTGTLRITSPMPGKVLRILVAAGDNVAEGQGLVVVEAMKMENELKTPRAGVVKEVCVSCADSVDSGALLVVID